MTVTLIDWLTDRLTVTLTDWLLESCRNRMATHSISRKRLTCFFILSRLDRSCWVIELLRYEDRHSARRYYHQEVLSLNQGYFYQQYLILSVQFYVLFWALFNWVSLFKAKAITRANQEKVNIFESRWELKEVTIKLPKARENAGDQVVIGFSFASDWLREWYEFSGPNTDQSNAKTKQSWITFDSQLTLSLPRSYQ